MNSRSADLESVLTSISDNQSEVTVKRAFQRLLHTISDLLPHSENGLIACVADRGPARAAGPLSEPFGIVDLRIIEEATFGSLCLDVFSHAVDDIADDVNCDKTVLAHLASLLLAKAAQVYARLVGADIKF